MIWVRKHVVETLGVLGLVLLIAGFYLLPVKGPVVPTQQFDSNQTALTESQALQKINLAASTTRMVGGRQVHSVDGPGGFSFTIPLGWKLNVRLASEFILLSRTVKTNSSGYGGITIEVHSAIADQEMFDSLRAEPDNSLDPNVPWIPGPSGKLPRKQNITVDGYPGVIAAERNLGNGYCSVFFLKALVRKDKQIYSIDLGGCEPNYDKEKTDFESLLGSWRFN